MKRKNIDQGHIMIEGAPTIAVHDGEVVEINGATFKAHIVGNQISQSVGAPLVGLPPVVFFPS
jgi:hypothetical protein